MHLSVLTAKINSPLAKSKVSEGYILAPVFVRIVTGYIRTFFVTEYVRLFVECTSARPLTVTCPDVVGTLHISEVIEYLQLYLILALNEVIGD